MPLIRSLRTTHTSSSTRRPSRWAAAAFGVAALAGQAAAKDICLTDGSSHYVFKKVKTLHPGAAVPLTGYVVFKNGFDTYPLTGTAMMKQDGTVVAGVTALELGGPGTSTILLWYGDTSLAGSGYYDKSPFSGVDGGVDLTSVDCSTIVVP